MAPARKVLGTAGHIDHGKSSLIQALTDFINTGTYDISNRPFVKTPTPSMDILVSSNLERQLFELTGRKG